MRPITRKDILALLKKQQGKRSLRAFAKDLKISAAYLSDVYLGKREPGVKILDQLALKKRSTRVVVYERAK